MTTELRHGFIAAHLLATMRKTLDDSQRVRNMAAFIDGTGRHTTTVLYGFDDGKQTDGVEALGRLAATLEVVEVVAVSDIYFYETDHPTDSPLPASRHPDRKEGLVVTYHGVEATPAVWEYERVARGHIAWAPMLRPMNYHNHQMSDAWASGMARPQLSPEVAVQECIRNLSDFHMIPILRDGTPDVSRLIDEMKPQDPDTRGGQPS